MAEQPIHQTATAVLFRDPGLFLEDCARLNQRLEDAARAWRLAQLATDVRRLAEQQHG